MPATDTNMKRRTFLTTTAGVATPLVAGCTGGGYGDGGGDESGDSQQQATGEGAINMVDTSFDPLKATIEPGTGVVWTNQDSFAHTVTSTQFHDKAASWDLDKEVSAGGTVSYTFDAKGVYEYLCTIHGKDTMCGAVLVGDVTLDKDLPCEGGGGAY